MISRLQNYIHSHMYYIAHTSIFINFKRNWDFLLLTIHFHCYPISITFILLLYFIKIIYYLISLHIFNHTLLMWIYENCLIIILILINYLLKNGLNFNELLSMELSLFLKYYYLIYLFIPYLNSVYGLNWWFPK